MGLMKRERFELLNAVTDNIYGTGGGPLGLVAHFEAIISSTYPPIFIATNPHRFTFILISHFPAGEETRIYRLVVNLVYSHLSG